MPFKIGWLDEKMHIYDIVLSDPFSLADQDQFFAEFFKFMDAGPVPMLGVFDVSRWSQSGAAGLNDPRFRKMGDYRKKIVVIVMVTKNKVTAAMGRLGAAVVGYRDWMRFEESREAAIKYLKERAVTEFTQRGLLPKEPAPQAQAPKEPAPIVPAPKAPAPTVPASTVPASTVPVSTVPVSTVPASTVPAPKAPAPTAPASQAQVPKEPAPKAPVPKEPTPQVQAPKAQAPQAQAPKEQAPKEQSSQGKAPKDQAP